MHRPTQAINLFATYQAGILRKTDKGMFLPSKKILVVLPSPLMARNFLRTQALLMLRQQLGAHVTVVSPNPDDRGVVQEIGATWLPYFHPRRWAGAASLAALQIPPSPPFLKGGTNAILSPPSLPPLEKGGRGGFEKAANAPSPQVGRSRRLTWYLRYLAGLALHMSLTYRLNSMCHFSGFAARLRQSWPLRKIYLREGLPMSRVFGFPWPRSSLVYRWLYRLYYSRWQTFEPVNSLVAQLKPDLVVLGMIQTHMVTPYALAARLAGIPILGINGSWDQPTTKGPVCPDIKRIVVQNDIVLEQLVRYHSIAKERIAVIGWLQMDAYAQGATVAHEDLFNRIGIAPGNRYILFAANAPRLGKHEPALVLALAKQIQAGALGDDVMLLCRCHPQDTQWQARWGWAAHLPGVVVEPPELGALDHLAALIRSAAVVIASAGSINLDAIALDTPTIGLAWEEPTLPYWDQPARAYDQEHLTGLRSSSGMAFARNHTELILACKRYLDSRTADSSGRAHLRERYLYRLDGGAAARLVNKVRSMLA